MNRGWMGVWVCVLAAAWVLPAVAREVTIADMQQAMTAAITNGDVAMARQQAHKILDAVADTPAERLTPDDQYAIGMAHVQVAGELLELAAQSGKLSAEQTAAIDKLRGTQLCAVTTEQPQQAALIDVSHGSRINLDDYLVAGKTTIVDFFSEYCPPCRALSPRLEALVKTRGDLNVVKVDINRPGRVGIDWSSPVAQQFELRSIPQLRIYGPDKKLQLEGQAAFDQILKWCEAR